MQVGSGMASGEVGREKGKVGNFKSKQPGLNQSRMPDRKHKVFNYNTSPEKIFLSASSLSLTVGGQLEMGGGGEGRCDEGVEGS